MRFAPVLLVLLLSACGGSGTTTADTPEATSSPTPTKQTATIEQYASIIAENRRDVDETMMQLEECSIDAISTCGFVALSASTRAEIVALQLNGASDPKSLKYVGDPPAEVAPLVDDTVSAAENVTRAFETYEVCGAPAECPTELFKVAMEFESLQESMDAWGPYL